MAKVIKQFDGVPDGQVQPRTFMPGDDVHGDLARVAVGEGWAEEAKSEEEIDTEGMKKAELVALAEERGIDLSGLRTKAEIQEAIDKAAK